MGFFPEELLFAPTARCNLACPHCDSAVARSKKILSQKQAMRFLSECASAGIKRVGFTGGEPFLAAGFLLAIVRSAVREGLLFDRIMTNGVWWAEARAMRNALVKLRDAGYDGSICVSVDAFHAQDLKKVACFIRTASSVWQRPDMISLARVSGARDKETADMIMALARILKAKVVRSPALRPYIKSDSLFLKINEIELAPTGKASGLKDPWNGIWFSEDHCKGPGNVFMVMPDGEVKPCCGYASDEEALTIGNIGRDSARDIIKGFGRNRFASTVFRSGLSAIRKKLENSGVRFPGKTSSHCFFCRYLLSEIPKRRLERCLDRR